jgi:hypothetical protein
VKITPAQTLYYFNGPVVFLAHLGLSHLIFQKFDEDDEVEYFVASETTPEAIEALRSGRMSLRGAIEAERFWVIRTRGFLVIDCIWEVSIYDFPLSLLPKKRNALFHRPHAVPDTVEQALNFFSVKYSDNSLSRESISFRKLKTLLSDVYEVANSYLIPSLDNISKYSVTDFEVAPIRFASLLVSLKRPKVLEDAIQRRKLNIAPTAGLLGQMQQQRDELMEGMDEVVEEAQRHALSTNFAGERFAWISALNTLTPPRNEAVDYIEVAASGDEAAKMVVIDASVAARIKDAHSEAIHTPVTLHGPVVVVNSTAATFVFRVNNVRQTTAALERDQFVAAIRSGQLVVGARVAVTGMLTRRTNRDYMTAGTVRYLP